MDYSGTPEPTFWCKWFGGVAVPIFFAIYGTRCCILEQAILHGRGISGLELLGKEAVALGLAWISLAFFLHFHHFWSALARLGILSELGKIVSALFFIASMGYVLCSVASGWCGIGWR
jgi:hypothetical protein